mmetsp:Transcript_72406/g.204676  ORF Transcript_72406/g.204676 Transcript_72406/m.204676 type:complete len:257 (-) Transcript_72406:253-1023(-)
MQSSPSQTICFGFFPFLMSRFASSTTCRLFLIARTLNPPRLLRQAMNRPLAETAKAMYGPFSRPRSRTSWRSTSLTGPSPVPTMTWTSADSSWGGGRTQMQVGALGTLRSAHRWHASLERSIDVLTKRLYFRVSSAMPVGQRAASMALPSLLIRSSMVNMPRRSQSTEKTRTTPVSKTQTSVSWALQPMASSPVWFQSVLAIGRPADVQVWSSAFRLPWLGWKTRSSRTVATGPPYGAPATIERRNRSGSSDQCAA